MARKPKEPKPKKQKAEKPEKPPKMRSSAPRRFGAWVLVIFMLSMVAFGAFKVINAPTEVGITRAIEKERDGLNRDTLARTKAVAFAERFAIAYFTNRAGEEWTAKMSAFYANGTIFTTPDAISEVRYVGTKGVEIDGDNVNVDVACQVAYATKKEAEFDMIQFSTIRVPINIDKDGNCAVVSTPIYVAESNNPQKIGSVMNTVSQSGNLLNEEDIETTVKNFLTTYYSGTSDELKYYVTKNYGEPATVGLNAEVENLDIRIAVESDYWRAECFYNIDNSGMLQEQHCFLEIVKGAEGRYYINKLSTF